VTFPDTSAAAHGDEREEVTRERCLAKGVWPGRGGRSCPTPCCSRPTAPAPATGVGSVGLVDKPLQWLLLNLEGGRLNRLRRGRGMATEQAAPSRGTGTLEPTVGTAGGGCRVRRLDGVCETRGAQTLGAGEELCFGRAPVCSARARPAGLSSFPCSAGPLFCPIFVKGSFETGAVGASHAFISPRVRTSLPVPCSHPELWCRRSLCPVLRLTSHPPSLRPPASLTFLLCFLQGQRFAK